MGKLVIIKGDTVNGRSRVSICGGIVPGVQVQMFDSDADATQWAVEMYGFYSKQGNRVHFSYT